MNIKIKQINFLFLIFFLSGQALFSQNYSSINNYTGAWETSASWNPVWPVPQMDVVGHNINIYGYITAYGSISLSGTSKLTVKDTLVIIGNLTVNDNNDIKIEDNGILIVWGNLTISDDTHIEANGYIIVTGDIIKVGDINHGKFTGNDNPVRVFIGGTIPSGLTNNNSDYQALNCTSPHTDPYPNSNCSYGNMTDIINDPIYPFFQSTCTIATPTITTGGPTTFCEGSSVTLTSSPGTTYLWSTGETTASIIAAVTGSYTVRVTNASGCQSAESATTIVIVNSLPATPVITADGPTTFCAGGSVTLTSSPGTTYLWSTGATTPSISVTTSGSYSVRVTNANGCQSALSVATIVTVNALPATPIITADGPTTFCEGGSVTLTSSPGSTYSWSTGATTQDINVTSSGSYSVKVTNANGCQSAASAAIVVSVNALPATPTIIADGPATFCEGENVNLTSSAGSSYLWSTGETTPAINIATTGNYTVRVTNINGCQSAASTAMVVTVNALPVIPTITAGGPTTFCAGGNVTLTSSAGSTYLWSTGETTASINVSASGNYSVRVTNANGCQSASSVATIVTVNALPATPSITAGSPTTFCEGGNVTLTSSAAANYLWSTGATTPVINVTAAGNYTVRVTDANGCQSAESASTAVNINALPVVYAGTDVTIPNGTSTTIDATVTGDGPFTYSWSPSGELVNSLLEDPTTVNLASTTIFTLTATSTATSCSNSNSVTITITGGSLNSTPTAAPGTICAGKNVQLRALASGGSGSYAYTWTSIPAGFTSSLADPVVNPSVNTTYNIVVFDGFTTVNAQVDVTVNSLPATPAITAGGPTTFCEGENVILTSSAGSSYLWSNGATSQSISVNSSGSYTVQVINGNGCQSIPSEATVVTVNALPATPAITAGGPTAFCEGGSVTLTSSAGTTFLWSTGETTASINVTAAGSYTVRVINASGCESAVSVPALVTVNALPAVPVISADGPATFCEGGSVTLTSSSGSSYLWSNGATTANINVASSGSYSVKITDTNGCQSAQSISTVVIVNPLPPTPVITPSGPTTFCDGSSVILTSSAGSTYLWSTGATTASINVNATGHYTVITTNPDGCQSSRSAATNVAVNSIPATPTIFADGPTTFCEGSSVTLISSPGSSYLWSTGETAENIIVPISGSYTVQVTNASGCQSAQSVPLLVTVNTLPITPTISANGPITFCEGGNVTLSSSPGSVYLWSTGNSTASIDVTSSGNYTVQVTNINGCQSALSAPTLITVNTLPAIPTITPDGPTTFCEDGSVTLTSSAGAGYLWSTGETTPNINVISEGTYEVQITDANGCQSEASANTEVIVNSIPEVIAGNNGPVCEGSSLSLTGEPAGMATYSWTGPGGFNSLLQNPVVSVNGTPDMAGVYTLKVVDVSGCTNTATTAVRVNALPSVNITSSSNDMCTGDVRTLTGSPAGGIFVLSDGPGSINGNTLMATGPGNIIIEYDYTNVCPNEASQQIIVNDTPVATAGPDQYLTFTSETRMEAMVSSSETGEWSLVSGTGHLGDIHSPTTMVTDLSAGENIFLWKVSNGFCENSAEVIITIDELIVPSVITPDGDGKNDYFKINGISEKMELIIFDRWGNEEFTNHNYLNDWDGRNNNGKELPADTYFYILKLENGQAIKGSVLIKR